MEWVIGLLGMVVTVLLAVFTAQSSRITTLQKQLGSDKQFLQELIAAEKDGRQRATAENRESLSQLRNEMTSHYVTYERLRETMEMSFRPMNSALERIEQDMQRLMNIQEVVTRLSTIMEQRQ